MRTEEHLDAVDRLHSRGLITDEEWRARRIIILSTPDEGDNQWPLSRGLAIAGAAVGLAFSCIAIFIGNAGMAFDADDAGLVVGLGVSALASSLAALVCGITMDDRNRARTKAAVIFTAAAWHVISTSAAGVPGAALMAASGVAWLMRR